MSQYPSPYPPSPYAQPPVDFSYYTPQADLLAPARRAAILQASLAALVLLCGVCLGAIPWVVDVGNLIAQSGMTLPQTPPGVSLEHMLRVAYTLIGVVGGLIGIGLLVLSFFVRNGGTAPAVTSIVLEGLVVLVLVMNLISGLVQLASNPAVGILVLLILSVLLGLFGLNIAWLIAVARNGSQIRAARQQYAAQYQHLQQQQQAYGQAGGYGMPYAPQGHAYPGQQPQGYGYPAPPAQQQQYPSAPPGAPEPAPAPAQDPEDRKRAEPADPNETMPPTA